MAATGPASRAVASLMLEALSVMPIAFSCLACAFRPECAPRASRAHPPVGQKSGNTSHWPPRTPIGPRKARYWPGSGAISLNPTKIIGILFDVWGIWSYYPAHGVAKYAGTGEEANVHGASPGRSL